MTRANHVLSLIEGTQARQVQKKFFLCDLSALGAKNFFELALFNT
jgi:hypothetical protein